LLENGSQKRQRTGRMTTSEIMIIVVSFHMSHYRNSKNYYLICVSHVYKKDFVTPDLLKSCPESLPLFAPLRAYFTSLKGKPTGIEFIDSTSIKLCYNIRTPRYITFDGIAKRGKGTMGWFYWFKLHLVVNHNGEIVAAAKIMTEHVHDTQPFAKK
jgi:hypothetical protein